MPISIRLTMLCLSGFELFSRWVPLMNDITIDKGIKERYPACKGFLSGCFFLGSMKSFTSADIYGDVNVLT